MKTAGALATPLLAEPLPHGERATTIGTTSRLSAFLTLTKPRIGVMVLFTVAVGFLVGDRHSLSSTAFWLTILGTGLVAGGASAWNQVLERDRDLRMRRTAGRPLPSGLLGTSEAATFATVLTVLLGSDHPHAWHASRRGGGCTRDVRPLCRGLHPVKADHHAQHGGRCGSGRIAARDRLGGGNRRSRDRSLGVVPHRFPLAVPPLSGDRLDLSRRLRQSRVQDAAVRRPPRSRYRAPGRGVRLGPDSGRALAGGRGPLRPILLRQVPWPWACSTSCPRFASGHNSETVPRDGYSTPRSSISPRSSCCSC